MTTAPPVSTSSIAFMRSIDSTISPAIGMVAPTSPVMPPWVVTGTRARWHIAEESRDVLGRARPHHRNRRRDGNAGDVGVVARVDVGAGQDRRRIERRAEFIDDGRLHVMPPSSPSRPGSRARSFPASAACRSAVMPYSDSASSTALTMQARGCRRSRLRRSPWCPADWIWRARDGRRLAISGMSSARGSA